MDFNNNVYCCGESKGLGFEISGDSIYTFTIIPGLKAKRISAGLEITAIIDLNNDVWTFGADKYPKDENINTPVQVPGFKATEVTTIRKSLLMKALHIQ